MTGYFKKERKNNIMTKILYFPKSNYILIHETKTYYYFASYGIIKNQHFQNEKFLKNKYGNAVLLTLSPTSPSKKVNEWIENLNKNDKEKYKIIVVDKKGG